ncbi:MAG: Uncharacterised protein [Rhodospirillaceae bacterium]|nr:MAG: Uncharacterised protein [Rhodospirillaceae bacterium]
MIAALVTLVLGLPLTAWSSGTGKSQGSGVQWLRMTHADFQEFFHENPQGLTLVFSAADGSPLGREYHAPDLSVFLEYGNDNERIRGQLSYAPGNQFCYRYPAYLDEFCWIYFQSEQGFMEESTNSDEIDYFQIIPGNQFEEQWGSNWAQRFD